MKSSLRLIPIDFTKPWWQLIINQKWLATAVLSTVIIRDLFWALNPFLITFVLEKNNWYFFVITCFIWGLAELNNLLQPLANTKFQLQCIHSIFYNAHQFLLAVDPQYHVKRSSGIVLAKIDRAARGYEELLDQITFEFAPLIIGTLSMLVILSSYSLFLASALSICLIAMFGIGYYFIQYACQKWENAFIKTDDNFHAAAFENLAQIHLIRATFATDYMQHKLTKEITINANTEKKLWLAYAFTSRILSLIYAFSILLLLGFLVHRVHHNIMSLPFALGLIIAYIQSTKQLIKIVQPLRKFMKGFAAVKDLFAFIPQFGKQTFPVFKQEHAPIRLEKKEYTLASQNIYFGYSAARIFDNHSLHIKTSNNQPNKLYGIIGPSGIGKTTLISILGGQLKPQSGSILVNGIDIYAISDDIRRQLITLQGQVATTVKGTVRYNLLFGLPEHHDYSDEYLIDIIKRVGLEPVLREYQGLDTQLSEGALNISGGQRQRLNFAGLYLRARYYKPVLILIDEPTSSLDEISEQAITAMIQELATSAITLVIAHRLKTLQDAAGLIDLSLLEQSNKISIYSPEELKKHSVYYQQLLEGKYELN